MTRLLGYFFPWLDSHDKKETAFVVETTERLIESEESNMTWALNPNHNSLGCAKKTTLTDPTYIGPNLRFETPESERAVSIMHSFGLNKILKIEKFIGYEKSEYGHEAIEKLVDRMTESIYEGWLPSSLTLDILPEKTKWVNVLGEGELALRKINSELGLGMDSADIAYYCDLFINIYKRNPTDVELAQIGQGNSSHCRHWEFNGRYSFDELQSFMPQTLFEMLKATHKAHPLGSKKAFKDNGGVLAGGQTVVYAPDKNGIYTKRIMVMDHTATAETHNHPTLISPKPGAETGVGGRLRDITDIKSGSLIGFGMIYFQTGKLYYDVFWSYPKNMATPREVF